MRVRRYPSGMISDTPAPTIEAKRLATEDRQPVHVQASLMEHVAVGAAWAGAVLGVILCADAYTRWPFTLWTGGGYGMLIAFLWATCYMATWHYSQDERLRGRDLRAWEEMEADNALYDEERRKALAEVAFLRRQLKVYEMPIGGKKATPTVTTAPQPASGQTAAQDEMRRRYEDAARAIAHQFEFGFKYTRDAMVAEGLTTASAWQLVMDELERKGLVERRGQGGPRVIVAFRSEDILRSLGVES